MVRTAVKTSSSRLAPPGQNGAYTAEPVFRQFESQNTVPRQQTAHAALQASVKARFRTQRRRRALTSFAYVTPLLAFIMVVFVLPLGSMLLRSIQNEEVVAAIPRTVELLRVWNGQGIPAEPVFAALVRDLREAADADRAILGNAAKRLNLEIEGFRLVLLSTARQLKNVDDGPFKEKLIEINANWADNEYWATLWRNTSAVTDFYWLSAIDLKHNAANEIIKADVELFIPIFWRTLWLTAFITAICLVLGYPTAYVLSILPERLSGPLMFFVLLPFWTSILVRTSAWIVILQTEGIVNQSLEWIGLITEPLRLIFNRTGMVTAMVHVMLPFMILPIYSVMKGIQPSHMWAARSLGANGFTAFLRVYLPLSAPGIGAGTSLVYILTLGYYITPQLVGGPRDQLISSFIAAYMSQFLNWGLASALAGILLVAVFLLYLFFHKFLHADKIRLT